MLDGRDESRHRYVRRDIGEPTLARIGGRDARIVAVNDGHPAKPG